MSISVSPSTRTSDGMRCSGNKFRNGNVFIVSLLLNFWNADTSTCTRRDCGPSTLGTKPTFECVPRQTAATNHSLSTWRAIWYNLLMASIPKNWPRVILLIHNNAVSGSQSIFQHLHARVGEKALWVEKGSGTKFCTTAMTASTISWSFQHMVISSPLLQNDGEFITMSSNWAANNKCCELKDLQ